MDFYASFLRRKVAKRRIPELGTLRRETRPWTRRIHRARTKVNWQFDRKTARRKFGYKKYFSKRS
jgi:hypothetical protein